MTRITALFLLLLLAAPVWSAPNGEQLYTRHCSVCHNDKGMGGIGLPLSGEKLEHFSRDYVFKTIRNGRPGRVMPPFVKLSDAQVDAIVDYIMSWRKMPPENWPDTPVKGDPANGERLFKEKCAACHGEDGKSNGLGTGVTLSRERKFKVVPPALNNIGFLRSAKDSWIRYTIQNGRPGTIMPSQKDFGISDSELDDLVSYIRQFEQKHNEKPAPEPEPPTLVFDSPYDFVTTVTNLKETLKGLNFRYFPDRYMEMGLAPDDQINKKQLSLRFCNFNLLYKMINIEPRLGVILPCRVTVVEEEDGSVKLYLMNMKVATQLFNNEQLSELARQMHENLMELIEEATL